MTLTPCSLLTPPRLSFVCQSIPMHSESNQVFYYSVFHPLFFLLLLLSSLSLGVDWGGGFVFSHRFCQSRPGRRLPGWHVASGLQWLETSRSLSLLWSSLLRFLFLCLFSAIFFSVPPPPSPAFLLFILPPIPHTCPRTSLSPRSLPPPFGFLIFFSFTFSLSSQFSKICDLLKHDFFSCIVSQLLW